MWNDGDPNRCHCPTTVVLEAFKDGRLPETELVAVAAHLETCRTCLTIVDGLEQVAPTGLVAVPELANAEALNHDPVFQQLRAFGRTLPLGGAALADDRSGADSEAGGARDAAKPPAAPETEATQAQESDQLPRPKPEPAKPEPALPEKIGDYFVLRKLGEGGFGVVYLAKDPQKDTTVAVKVPKAGPRVTERRIQAFLREARLVAELAHPQIVTVRDFQRLPDVGCCVVMPYYDGGSLARFLQQERVAYARAAQWIADLAECLHEVHRRKLVHRDIKPANVLLDGHGQLHLTDFGLALLDEDRWLHRDELAGTRAYMSPEQVQARTQFIDSRTDIWSLGVIFFEMLTRERPFRGRTAEELCQEILHKHPNPRTITPGIPVELERICVKCLQKAPAERYTHVLDLAVDLRSWLAAQDETTALSAAAVPGASAAEPRPRPAPRAGVAKESRFRAVWWSAALVAGGIGVAWLVGNLPLPPAIVPGEARGSLPPLADLGQDRIPLLDRAPVMFSWDFGDGREEPRFDAREQRYVVRSDRTRWIARAGEVDARPVELRAAISLDNWVGFGGIVWGLRLDPDAFPEKRYRCFSVEYFRVNAVEPAKLAVMEISLTEQSFDQIRITFKNAIAVQDVAPPLGLSAVTLEAAIEPHRLRVRFNQGAAWTLTEPLETTTWLPNGRTAVGLTGQGRETAIRGLSFRYLPATKESLP